MKRIVPGERKQSVKTDSLDRVGWKDIRKEAEELRTDIATNQKKLTTAEELAQDLFHSLYKYNPELKDDGEIESTHAFNKKLIRQMMDTKEYEKLRNYTKLQKFESSIACKSFLNELISSVPQEDLDAVNNAVAGVEEASEEVSDLFNRLSQMDDDTLPEHRQAAQDALNRAQEQLDNAKQNLNDTGDGLTGELSRAMRGAAQAAHSDATQFANAAAGWGLEEGQLSTMSWKEKAELAKILLGSHQLRRVAEIVGRLKRLALAKRKQRTKFSVNEYVDIEQGDNLSRLLASEKAFLDDPDLEPIFLHKYAQKQLAQYKLGGKERQGKGPIIMCVDESGSMSGDRIAWAKALTMALGEIARIEKRAFHVISFGHGDSEIQVWPWETMDLKQKIQDFAGTLVFGGGTSFQAPLKAALKLLVEVEPKADIVFLTDGECGDATPEWVAQHFKPVMDKVEGQVHGIAVGFSRQPESLKRFCDSIHNIDDMASELRRNKVSGAIFGAIQ